VTWDFKLSMSDYTDLKPKVTYLLLHARFDDLLFGSLLKLSNNLIYYQHEGFD
jgi:hypothetical protein